MTARRAAAGVVGVVAVALSMRAAIAGIPPVLDDLGLDTTDQSLLVTIPIVCFGAGALAGPRVRAWLGEELAIFLLLGAMVAGVALRAAWPDSALFTGTIIVGLSVALLNVLLPSLVKQRFPNHAGPLTAAYTTALSISAGLAAGLTVPVLHATDSRGAALAIWGLPAALALLVWLPQVRRSRGGVRSPRVRRGDARAMWSQPTAWAVMLFMGMQSISFYGLLSWLPVILRDGGVDATSAGVVLAVMATISIAGSMVTPVIAARAPDQRAVVAISVGLVAIGTFALLVAPTVAPVLWALLVGLGQGGCFGLALLFIVLRAADAEAAARLSSMAQAGGYLVGALGPLAMGLLHALSGGWTAPLVFMLSAVAVELAVGLAAARDRLVHYDHHRSLKSIA